MITEDYVSFETAKLLKKKRFDCSSYNHYRLDNGELCHFNTNCSTNLEQNDYITAPTLQMVMKWLRDISHLEIYPFHDAIQENNNWWYRIERHSKGCSLTEHESDIIYKTYEEACEAAIKYCLENLI